LLLPLFFVEAEVFDAGAALDTAAPRPEAAVATFEPAFEDTALVAAPLAEDATDVAAAGAAVATFFPPDPGAATGLPSAVTVK